MAYVYDISFNTEGISICVDKELEDVLKEGFNELKGIPDLTDEEWERIFPNVEESITELRRDMENIYGDLPVTKKKYFDDFCEDVKVFKIDKRFYFHEWFLSIFAMVYTELLENDESKGLEIIKKGLQKKEDRLKELSENKF